MKRLLTLAVLLAAAVAYAGTYTLTTTTAQDSRLERERLRVNKATCAAAQLPPDCTQAQARKTTPGVEVYSDVSDMLNRMLLRDFLQSLKNADTSDDQAQFCAWFAGATTAQRNQACALAGLPNGCEACSVP